MSIKHFINFIIVYTLEFIADIMQFLQLNINLKLV